MSENSLSYHVREKANSNHGNQNSLTQRIVPQLRCLRKLLFIHSINDHSISHKKDTSQRITPHLRSLRKLETEKFIFTIIKLLTPSRNTITEQIKTL